MLTIQNILLFLSVLLSALITGLLYGYACSVNPGLGKLSDAAYILAMQSVNREILNPFFFVSFIGTLIILPIATFHSRFHASPACFYLLLAASLTYIIGVIGVTALVNIPLNNSLAKVDVLSSGAADLLKHRSMFEPSWNRYHLIRTLFSILTTALTIVAIIKNTEINHKSIM